MVKITIDVEKCTGCGTCIDVCPAKVYELVESGGSKVSVAKRPERCLECHACEYQCPASAIKID